MILVASLCAHAATTGDEWLTRIDDTARVSDAHLTLEVTVTDARGRTKPRTIEIWQKGDNRRLVRLTAPARLAGIGLLASPGDTLHLFIPQYPPARRVVGSKRADALMGTDFAIEDLSRMTFADDYTATVKESSVEQTHLILKSSTDPDEPALHVWVDKAAVVRKIEHMDSSGAPTRRLILDDIRTVNGTPLPHHMKVTDLSRNRVTEAHIKQIEIGTGFDDVLFSVSQLERY
jgi:outer membrane lipoprotein-sorting protein